MENGGHNQPFDILSHSHSAHRSFVYFRYFAGGDDGVLIDSLTVSHNINSIRFTFNCISSFTLIFHHVHSRQIRALRDNLLQTVIEEGSVLDSFHPVRFSSLS